MSHALRGTQSPPFGMSRRALGGDDTRTGFSYVDKVGERAFQDVTAQRKALFKNHDWREVWLKCQGLGSGTGLAGGARPDPESLPQSAQGLDLHPLMDQSQKMILSHGNVMSRPAFWKDHFGGRERADAGCKESSQKVCLGGRGSPGLRLS